MKRESDEGSNEREVGEGWRGREGMRGREKEKGRK